MIKNRAIFARRKRFVIFGYGYTIKTQNGCLGANFKP